MLARHRLLRRLARNSRPVPRAGIAPLVAKALDGQSTVDLSEQYELLFKVSLAAGPLKRCGAVINGHRYGK